MANPPADQPGFDEFVALVDAHVTPHMRRLGYARIGPSVDADGGSRALLARPHVSFLGRRSRARKPKQAAVVHFTMGYEACDDEALARLYPDDPLSGEEVWLDLDTGSGDLDLLLAQPLDDFLGLHAQVGEAQVILSAEHSLAVRMVHLDGVLDRFVHALLHD